MTMVDALIDVARTILGEQEVSWSVALAPPAGHVGPCLAIRSCRIQFGMRTSLESYPVLAVEIELSGVDAAGAEQGYHIARALAEREWESERFAALSGRLTEWTIERDEGARQERFVASGSIEYQLMIKQE